MTSEEIREALKAGHDRFRHKKSGKVYLLDPLQWECLCDDDADSVLLIGYPETPHSRQRGRKWSWLSPENLEAAK